MKKFQAILFTLSCFCTLALIALLVNTPPQQAVRSVDGEVELLQNFDALGRKHGVQRMYFKGQLRTEQGAEHGYIIWSKHYNQEGHLTLHLKENDSYDLVQMK